MFDYNSAFSRNIGWVTEDEQRQLGRARVAIAGAGGVGSEHMVTLARMGIQNFTISDFDQYEVHNFNRQAGAFMSTVGCDKVKVMENVILDINPQADIRILAEGVDASNIDQFLEGVDIYVDSLDFFALAARKLVFQACLEKGIPVVTAAPLGMGCAFLAFMPGKMTYEEYFNFSKGTEDEQLLKFLIGLSPSMLQTPYLVVKESADFKARKGPSTPMSVKLCSGVACTNVVKILLKRGDVIAAPWGLHFDAYRNKLVKTWRPFGNRGLRQRIVFSVAKRLVFKAE